MKLRRPQTLLLAAAPWLLALGFLALLLVALGVSPWAVLREITAGAVGARDKLGDVLVVWVPLLMAASGLLITFTAGLWNIGIEGQITIGAICATWVLRVAQSGGWSPVAGIAAGMAAGILGGAVWAALAGFLKTHGGVNEIFAGLGLNFVAGALTLWLIFGPWKRPGIGSMSGTEPFPVAFRLSGLAGTRVSLIALLLGITVFAACAFLLRNTYAGLRWRAVGLNPRAARVMGIPSVRYILYTFLIGGAIAGLAGAIQVVGVYYRLIPSISSGYGYLGLLTAMAAGYRALWVPFIAIFFAVLNVGSIQLPISFNLDSSLAGVLQGGLVLCVLMFQGVRQRLLSPENKT